MHTVGYAGSHSVAGGNADRGGGGAGPPATSAKPRTGCSSTPFGATPVCPCRKSKKPTPASVAVPVRCVNCEEDGWPNAASSAALAVRISAASADATAPEH